MRFLETRLPGAYIIELEPNVDDRGFFARAWCQEEFQARGLQTGIAQCNIGHSEQAGTVRGIHFQRSPHEETKVVRCTRGEIFDVIVDVRPNSPTFGETHCVELTADNHRLIYIPAGMGHGYQTLTDHAEVFYQASEFYFPELSDGLRYNDPSLAIDWPLPVTGITERDLRWPDFAERGDFAVTGTQNST